MHVQGWLTLWVLTVSMATMGCDSEVRQQRPPRIPDEAPSESLAESSDIQPEPEPGPVPTEVNENEPSEADKKRACCEQCVKGADKDRTGDSPDKIPCADLTADLDDRCRKYFVKSPMSAAEAKTCVAALGSGEVAAPSPGESDQPPAEGAPSGNP